MKQQALTKAEMQVMNALWQLPEGGTVNEVLGFYDEPKPAYTTIATFLRILQIKGFLQVHKKKGDGKRLHYVPVITKDEYTRNVMRDVKDNFFDGSVKKLLSFFAREEKISAEEIRDIYEMVNGKD